jgi:hypothetical protein
MGKTAGHAPSRALWFGACLVLPFLAGCQKKDSRPPSPPPPERVQVVDVGDNNVTTTLSCEVTAGGKPSACKVVSCSPGAHIDHNKCVLDDAPVARTSKCTIVDGSRRTKRC